MELRNNTFGEPEPCHLYTLILKMRNSDMCLHNAYIPLLSSTLPLVEASEVRRRFPYDFFEECVKPLHSSSNSCDTINIRKLRNKFQSYSIRVNY